MRILIVEDEKVAARGLERLLREALGVKISTLKIQGTLTASECFLQDNPIDLLFLDLNLGGEDGFELLKMAAAGSFQTIVVSANTDRAIEAFSHGVLDFVPKPITQERLNKALARLDTTLESRGEHARYLSIRKEERVVLIDLNDICYFQGHDNYVLIHMKEDGTEQHRKTLESLQKILPPNFFRIHKSFLLDLSEIKQIHSHTGSRYDIELNNGDFLPLSRTRYKELKERLG